MFLFIIIAVRPIDLIIDCGPKRSGWQRIGIILALGRHCWEPGKKSPAVTCENRD